MFKRILIANRGEIAYRIIKTAHKLGVEAVAIYSPADQDACHVEMADFAVSLGNSDDLSESYLNIDKIVKAAKDSGAQAIHPGYGFLSENAKFAEAVSQAGLVFIGPSIDAIKLMGDKITSKEAAKSAGVSTIPGSNGAIKSVDDAKKMAAEIGFPVMLKAAAGGGGKGMRVAHNEGEVEDAFQRAASEAQSSFGDNRIFIEKFINNPRHIEIQVLGDQHGNVVYLGERECSLQRRHQKIIEESPSTFVDNAMRAKMGEQAVSLAKSVGYYSAGTVEFVVGDDKQFYFLEMNTRLQVEHPVTELVYCVDLVEEMLRIADGQKLQLKQSGIFPKGHAIEARIYAEDSARGFLPSSGRLVRFIPPLTADSSSSRGGPEGLSGDLMETKLLGIRLDSGVREGDTITTFFDPMVAKLIAYGTTREAARASILNALDQFYIEGIATNIPFLSHLLSSDEFIKGSITTTYLDQHYKDGFEMQPHQGQGLEYALAASAVMYLIVNGLDPESISKLVATMRGEYHDLQVCITNPNTYEVKGPGWQQIVECDWKAGLPLFKGVFNGHSISMAVSTKGLEIGLSYSGGISQITVLPPRIADYHKRLPEKPKPDLSRVVTSPMPGMVVDVLLSEGDQVKIGQPILIIEAMKMENIIRSAKDGFIEKLHVKKGESVNVDQLLAQIAA